MVRLGAAFFGSTPPGGVYCIFRDVVNCAGGCVGTNVFFFRRFSAQAPASQIPLGPAFPVSVISTMAEFTKFEEAQVSGQPPISEELMTLLTAATVHKSILDGFRALGIATCGRFSSLADDLPDLREALSEMFNVDKKHGPLHRLEASKLVEVWQQAKARTETQQKVESTARAHGMPVELPAGSWGNLMKAFQDQYGSSIPPKELPAQSYFEVLEEMVQDRVFYAESLAQVVSLDTENKHRLANPETHSQHIAMLFDGSTIRPKRRLVSSMPEDLEGFRAKYEIIANVWRMMKLRSPGRAVLAGLTENTWDTHRKWLMDSKRFAMELEVAPGVLKAPGWQLCLSYEQKVREAVMDLIRLQCLPLAEALDRVRNDQEHRMFHWVQLFMQPGHQRVISAPASSSSSSSSAKRSAAVSSNSQPSEVRALTSKLDKLASTVKLLAEKSSSGGKTRDRSRSLEGNEEEKFAWQRWKRQGQRQRQASPFRRLAQAAQRQVRT